MSYTNQLLEIRRNQAQKFRIQKFLNSSCPEPSSSSPSTTNCQQEPLPQDIKEEELWVLAFSFVSNDNAGFFSLLRLKLVCRKFHRLIEYRPEIWNDRFLTLDSHFAKNGTDVNVLLGIKNYCEMYRIKGYNLKNIVFKNINFSDLTSFISRALRYVHGVTFDNCSSIDMSFDINNENGDVQFIQCSTGKAEKKKDNALSSRDHWLQLHIDTLLYQPKWQEGLPFSHVRRVVLDSGDINLLLFRALSVSWPDEGFHLVIKGDLKRFLDNISFRSPQRQAMVRYLTIYPRELSQTVFERLYLNRITSVFSSVEIIYLGDSDKFIQPSSMSTRGVKHMREGFIFSTENNYSRYEEEKRKKWAFINRLKGAHFQFSPEVQRSMDRIVLEEKRLLLTKQYLGAFSIDRLNRNDCWIDGVVQVKVDYDLEASQGRTTYFDSLRQIVQEHSDLIKWFPEKLPIDCSDLSRRIDQLSTQTDWSPVEEECRKLKQENEQMRSEINSKIETETVLAGYA